MSDYKRNPGRPAGNPGRSAGNRGGSVPRSARPPMSGAQARRPQPYRKPNARPAARHPAFKWQDLSEARIPMWAGVSIIAATVMIVALVSVLLIRGTGKDVPKDAPAGSQIAVQATEQPTAQPDNAEPTAEAPASTAEDPAATQETPATGGETATSAPKPSGSNRSATIRMAGDVIIDTEMLQASYDKSSKTYNFEPYFELIGDTLSSADYTMINIEASLRKGKYGYSGYPQFTTPPVILDVVKKYGADMITMCNNHMLDGYCDGLVESVGHVEKAGLDHIGGYVDEADSNTPEIYEINGIKVGFVTYTHSTNSLERHCDDRTKFLVNYFKNSNCYTDIQKARAAGAEVIVAVTHWGDEYKRQPESTTRKYAQALVAAGADVIIGGHPHMVQPAEYITVTDGSGNSRTALCLYSLGNFLSQHRVQYTDSGVVFEFTIQENADGTFSIVKPGYVPVYVWTFKNSAGHDDYRVLPVGQYLNNPPSGMSSDQVSRMKQSLQETLELMGGNSVITALEK